MIPSIFVSSTVSDLHHIRESVKDLLLDLGYNPVLSDWGGVGYSPWSSAEESCYETARRANLGIVIIGKKYGSIGKDGLSITDNEIKVLRQANIPIVFLIDDEIKTFERVYSTNPSTDFSKLGMDNPEKTFALIKTHTASEINNGYVTFSTVSSVRENIKKQLAHIFGELLSRKFDTEREEIKTILSEVSALKHILIKGDESETATQYSSAFSFMLSDEMKQFKALIESISGSLEKGIVSLMKSESFDDYLNKSKVKLSIDNDATVKSLDQELMSYEGNGKSPVLFWTTVPFPHIHYRKPNGFVYNIPTNGDNRVIVFGSDEKIITNDVGHKLMSAIFERFKSIVSVGVNQSGT